TQVQPMARIVIFLALMLASFVFAWKLRMFEPVLRHHWDPETGEDVLITPDDPAFELEEERAREERAEHAAELRDHLPGRRG
ncbi:MAG: undecaprenyl/decaprenyl-phosphate alpha-N-acetylglucosaminyl 1-phosphate transferase, partial [Atopobiaceae bacterium]|nr:undecaprenyl/decaprenyl-phosphate alpha-N-acetylglucosaminyl 1-phosphate transferase [Atopobiaceae bacterium]